MPVDAVPLNVTGFPGILAGPIVRRLTRSSVCVWVALSRGTDITLHVTHGGSEVTAPATPVQIGSNLWLAAPVCAAPGGTFAAGSFYNYKLTSPGWSEPDWKTLALGGANLPGFPGLPTKIEDLTILHVSCRKWAGGGDDALALAADVIEQRISSQMPNARPHLLIHSGDQMYADDVASPLAPRIRRIAKDFVVGTGSSVFLNEEDINLFHNTRFAGRQENCTNDFNLTSTSARDHLWTLAEFYAAYLLAWSDVLWPPDIPDFNSIKDELDERAALDEDAWKKLVAKLQLFRDAIPNVRRVLANVPSLMLLDDHEVTDDWNINWGWVDGVYNTDGGRRVVANGLLAYNLFQHWGNVPDRYATTGTTEKAILTAAAFPGPATEAARAALDLKVGMPVTVDREPPAPGDPPPFDPVVLRDLADPAAIRYDFVVGPSEGYPLRIVFLDERTVREFPDNESPAARISFAALSRMVPAPVTPPLPATIVVAPSALFGTHVIEHVLQPASAIVSEGGLFTDFESWPQQPLQHQELLKLLAKIAPVVVFSGDVHYGAVSKASFTIGGKTTPFVQLVCSAAKNADDMTMALHQLGDLAIRLGVERPRHFQVFTNPGSLGLGNLDNLPPLPMALPWDDLADLAFGRARAAGAHLPLVLSAEIASAYGTVFGPVDWEYAVSPVDDQMMPTAGGPLDAAMAAAPEPWSGWNPDNSLDLLKALRAKDLHRIGRVMVGLPQIALVHFTINPLTVHQSLFLHGVLADSPPVSVKPKPVSVNTKVELT